MKTLSNMFALLNKKTTPNNVKEVKENAETNGHKTFSSVDLWNIQRKSRTALDRRSVSLA